MTTTRQEALENIRFYSRMVDLMTTIHSGGDLDDQTLGKLARYAHEQHQVWTTYLLSLPNPPPKKTWRDRLLDRFRCTSVKNA